MSSLFGLIIGRSRPHSIAMVRKVLLIIALAGSPKLMLDTPRHVLSPSRSLTILKALRVSTTSFCCADTVSVRQSIITFSLGMPYSRHFVRIRSAIANLSYAVSGIPFSSKVRPTTAAPYFLTDGKILSMTASSPLTELTIALPLYTLSAASMASGLPESI